MKIRMVKTTRVLFEGKDLALASYYDYNTIDSRFEVCYIYFGANNKINETNKQDLKRRLL